MSDYTAATWIGSPNYTPGRQQGVRYITLHIMAGYLAGTDTTRYVSPAGLAAALDARGSGFTWWDGTGDEPEGPDGEFVVTPA